LIRLLRNISPAFRRAFIYGFTLRYEGVRGLDSSIELPTGSFLIALQFKKFKPEQTNILNRIWAFEINNNDRRDQHLKLLISAYLLGTNNVYYAFPLIDSSIIRRISPNFLNRTCFARIIDFPAQTFNNKTHLVYIQEPCRCIRIRSEKGVIKLLSAEELLDRVRKGIIKPLPVEELSKKRINKEELEDFLRKKDVNEWIIREFLSRNWRQMLKGFFF